jgi:hypothetical protein
VAPNFTKHQQQGTSGKRAANSVSAGKKRFEPVRRGVGDSCLQRAVPLVFAEEIDLKSESKQTTINKCFMENDVG